MNWNYVAGGCLALWLLPQVTALANAPVDIPNPTVVADSPAPPATEANQPPTDQVLPWADLLDGDTQQPLRVGEYNRIIGLLWVDLNDQRALRSSHIAAACDALGSDMRYLRGRVPRQIEDAHRQMAPFQSKGLADEFTLGSFDTGAQSNNGLADALGAEDYTEAEAMLELMRSGEDPHLYETYRQLFSHFLRLDLADYLDPDQDEVPLSRTEFVSYVETLYQEWQDPTGSLAQHEQFLEESDRLIQDLLTLLREVRRSLATLESTKAYTNISLTEAPKPIIAPAGLSSPQSTLSIAQSTTPTLDLAEEAFVTRRAFLLAMLDLLLPLEFSFFQSIPWCGNYQVGSWNNPAQEMEREVAILIRDLDLLNFEILELVNTRLR